MKLTFLGTRGNIEEKNKKHKYHSSLLIIYKNFRLLVDYGEEHKHSIEEIKPDAILITHAHPDHYIWLNQDVKINKDVEVYLTKFTLDYGKYKPRDFIVIEKNKWFKIGPFRIKAYDVLHSIRCPAVCFKIKTENKTFVYASDLVDIKRKEDCLQGVDVYIGDGATFRGLVRRKGSRLFGHTRIITQLNWCKKYKIPTAIFTHFGKEIVEMPDKKLNEKISEMQEGAGVKIVFAYDGLKIEL